MTLLYRHTFVCSRHLRQISGVADMPEQSLVHEPARVGGDASYSEPMPPLEGLSPAERTLDGIEAMHMTRKGQVKTSAGSDTRGPTMFVATLFQLAA
jgi:hypothetical protein